MKASLTLLIFLVVSACAYAQTDTLSDKKDTTRIVVGKKEIKIIPTRVLTLRSVKKNKKVMEIIMDAAMINMTGIITSIMATVLPDTGLESMLA